MRMEILASVCVEVYWTKGSIGMRYGDAKSTWLGMYHRTLVLCEKKRDEKMTTHCSLAGFLVDCSRRLRLSTRVLAVHLPSGLRLKDSEDGQGLMSFRMESATPMPMPRHGPCTCRPEPSFCAPFSS